MICFREGGNMSVLCHLVMLREYDLVNCAPGLFFSVGINCCEENDSCTAYVGYKRTAPFRAIK